MSDDRYSFAVARVRELEAGMDADRERWRAREAKFRVVEGLARDLCAPILAKERDEMVLGKKYSWDSVDIADLLRKAIVAQRKQARESAKRLTDLQNAAEEARKVSQELRGSQDSPAEPPAPPNAGADAAEAGGAWPRDLTIVHEDGDPESAEEKEILSQVAESMIKPPVTPYATIQIESQKDREDRAQRKLKAAVKAFDINDYKDVPGQAWDVLDALGDTGFSRAKDITAYIEKKYPGRRATSSMLTNGLMILRGKGLLETQRDVKVVRGKQVNLFWLSELGGEAYRHRHGGTLSVKPEARRVKSEHGGFSHGYNILYLAEALRKNNYVKSAEWETGRQPVVGEDGRQSVPDLIVTTAGGRTVNIEYEMGNTSQRDFNAKIGKWVEKEGHASIVVPNRDTLESVKKQVEKWRETFTAPPRARVRVSTDSHLGTLQAPLDRDGAWTWVYDIYSGTWSQNTVSPGAGGADPDDSLIPTGKPVGFHA